jgi:hypothetical protein
MDKRYVCYCGLYCEHCLIRAKVYPAAKNLHDEMSRAGFDQFINFVPGGDCFWPFLKDLADDKMFVSCQEGCGDPGCKIRICAKEKGMEVCALCESYPCDNFGDFLTRYPLLARDNLLIREKGFEAWSKLQDERRARGFILQDEDQSKA